MKRWDRLVEPLQNHLCEIETDGLPCGRVAHIQSVYTWHKVEQRFCWVCGECADARMLKHFNFQDPM